MNQEYPILCKKEIASLLKNKLIRKSYTPQNCTVFYVNNIAEREKGVPHLIINYKALNKVLKWIRYPLSNKRDLLNHIYKAKIFSNFDLKYVYWQIQINEKDHY